MAMRKRHRTPLPTLTSDEICQYATLRLVCRRWKSVADTFLFKEFCFGLQRLESFQSQFSNAETASNTVSSYDFESRLLNTLLQRDNCLFIRTIRVIVPLTNDFRRTEFTYSLSEQYLVYVTRWLDMIREIIFRSSQCQTIILSVFQFRCSPRIVTNILDHFASLLRHIPERCPQSKVELDVYCHPGFFKNLLESHDSKLHGTDTKEYFSTMARRTFFSQSIVFDDALSSNEYKSVNSTRLLFPFTINSNIKSRRP